MKRLLILPVFLLISTCGGNSSGQCFFGFAPLAPGEIGAILGQVTMENYYVHFDRKFNTNQGRIGFGPNTLCNTSPSNSAQPTCDTDGLPLKHVVNGKASTNGSEYRVLISVGGTVVNGTVTGGTVMEAIADTGSSNLLIANNTRFTPTPPSGDTFTISYGSGSEATFATLTAYHGLFDLPCTKAQIPSMRYGYIEPGSTQTSTLLGLAYRSLQRPPADDTKPAFFAQLVSNTGINDEFAMLLCGVNNSNSRINFGGISSSAAELNQFNYTPITKQSYYVVSAGAVLVGSQSAGDLTGVTTIVDSGTTLNLVPQAIYDAIVAQIPGGSNIPAGSSMSCPSADALAKMPNVTIALQKQGGGTFDLVITPQTYFKKIN